MPLDEEGAKWSCEPCVRGHRSSKCQHFDRLMMKVPKAGRPLAKCPHPKGSCSCQKTYAVMVRIPKGSTCLCRPLYQVSAESTEVAQSPTTSGTTSNSPAPGRIHKNPRRQSNIQAAPENIAKAINSASDLALQINHGTSTSQSLSYPNFVQHPGPTSGMTTAGQTFPTLLPKQKPLETEADKPSTGTCCSKEVEPVSPVQPQRSCCSGPEPLVEDKGDVSKEEMFSPAWNNATNMTSQRRPWTSSRQTEHYPVQNPPFGHTSIQNSAYTNSLFTRRPPAPPISYSLSTNYNVHSFNNTAEFNQLFHNTQAFSFMPSSTTADECTHECSCGDDCQCLGCASHPFNNTTRQHVQEMDFMMSTNEDDENSEGSTPFMGPISPHIYPVEVSTSVTSNTEQHSHAGQDLTQRLPSPNFDNVFPGSSDYARQFMQPSEYYTLEYPVGLPNMCSNIMGTCQCGSDCNCVGCLTHSGHNGVALEPVPEQSRQPDDGSTPYGFYHHETMPRLLDDFLPSASSSSIIEAPLV